jgi:hypothetical protein
MSQLIQMSSLQTIMWHHQLGHLHLMVVKWVKTHYKGAKIVVSL